MIVYTVAFISTSVTIKKKKCSFPCTAFTKIASSFKFLYLFPACGRWISKTCRLEGLHPGSKSNYSVATPQRFHHYSRGTVTRFLGPSMAYIMQFLLSIRCEKGEMFSLWLWSRAQSTGALTDIAWTLPPSFLVFLAIFREVGGEKVKQTLHFPAPLIRANILSITVTWREEVKFESVHSNSAGAFLHSIYDQIHPTCYIQSYSIQTCSTLVTE